MAQIVVNEISDNYTFNIGTASYAAVAFPITSSWGPGYFDADTFGANVTRQDMLEATQWKRFPATKEGLESFVSTYRGPASCYRMANDYSYQMAITLLTAGYDVVTCRMCPGQKAMYAFKRDLVVALSDTVPVNTVLGAEIFTFRAKYPGTFGNNLKIAVNESSYYDPSKRKSVPCHNVITYITDSTGAQYSAENITLVFDRANASDTVLYYKEVKSNFWDVTVSRSGGSTSGVKLYNDLPISSEHPLPIVVADSQSHSGPGGGAYTYSIQINDSGEVTGFEKSTPDGAKISTSVQLTSGSDYNSSKAYNSSDPTEIANLADKRYQWAYNYREGNLPSDYIANYTGCLSSTEGQSILAGMDSATYAVMYYKEWLFTELVGHYNVENPNTSGVFDILKDKLSYDYNRIISPGWDDQDILMYVDGDITLLPTEKPWDVYSTSTAEKCEIDISPLHAKIMDVAYYSRCGTGFVDVPKVLQRKYVHIEDAENSSNIGYVQMLSRMYPPSVLSEQDGSLFTTHSAFFAPWGQYTYTTTGKMSLASPSFLALMIQRAQILNQAIQYEWALPTNRKQNLRIGEMAYSVPKKLLDQWQKLEGASVNVITDIPDLGTSLWGNSTLFEVPPSTYQALANLSTRYVVNAVKDIVYRCGLSITFNYNNQQAYNKFYAGVIPTLDSMKNVGAIQDYRITMSADINGVDHVNANTVVGKIWLVVNGVINDIYVDLIALPAGLGIDLSNLS